MTPPSIKFVTYYRVSTQRQGRSGLGLEAQQASVKRYLTAHGGRELASYTEVESGKNNERPQLHAALTRCKLTHATLLVAKLDRLSRDAAFLLTLQKSEVKLLFADMPDATEMMVGFMALMAEYERKMISERTKAALAARRARGLPLGNPRDLSPYAKRASAMGGDAHSKIARERAKLIAPQIAAAQAEGRKSLRAIAHYLNELEIATPRGSRWTATAVKNTQKLIARS